MSKMKELAKLMNVELGKPFRLKGLNGKLLENEYCLYETGLYRRPNNSENFCWVECNLFLIDILNKGFEVVEC